MADDKKNIPVVPPAAPAPSVMDADLQATPEAGKKSFLKKPLTSRERVILQVAVLAILVVVIDFAVIHPIGGYLDRLNEKIKLQEQMLPKRLMILKHKNKIVQEYKSIESLVVDPKITQEQEIAKFLREIERVSKGVGLFVSNINPVKVGKDSEVVYHLSVDIDGKGGLKEIRRFIRMIETENPSMRVESFSLKPQSKDSDELKYQLSISKMSIRTAPAVATEATPKK